MTLTKTILFFCCFMPSLFKAEEECPKGQKKEEYQSCLPSPMGPICSVKTRCVTIEDENAKTKEEK